MKGVLESVIAKETADFESSAAGGGRSSAAAAEQVAIQPDFLARELAFNTEMPILQNYPFNGRANNFTKIGP